MALRSSIDLELVPLLKALRSRIEGLGDIRRSKKDGLEVYSRASVPFLQLEIKRDHLYLDMWLPEEGLEEARASGIARPHPFMVDEAVRVRFERAEDLTKVTHWLERAFRHAAGREDASKRPKKRKANGAEKKATADPREAPKREPEPRKPPKKDPSAQEPPKKDPPSGEPPRGDPPKKAPPKKANGAPKASAPKTTGGAKKKSAAKKTKAKRATSKKSARR